MTLNGLEVQVEEGWTILDAARFYGIEIPTLCYHDGLSPYGACRLCVVEIGEGGKAKLVSSCTYPVEKGLKVRTHSKRVVNARKMIVELLLSSCPSSKTIQDLASRLEVQRVRFKMEHEDCIHCGLCVRMCAEQMDARAIGFVNRGKDRRITTPFDIKSEVCRTCGACIYICPACQLRCQGPEAPTEVCGSCMSVTPVCLEKYDDAMCFLDPCCWCLKEKEQTPKEQRKVEK
jgi:NADH dehydrogenase/NADH:ubiquinone oxidoreductase subunit G